MSWLWESLPRPSIDAAGTHATRWNSVALFFNLTDGRPARYEPTTAQDARNWLDEGVAPASPAISRFMAQYWGTLSYGHLAFGIDTPRDGSGAPLLPDLPAPADGTSSVAGVYDLIRGCVRANPEAVWRAAGELRSPAGNRWIPSVVLVHRYPYSEWAWNGFTETIDGQAYEVSRVTHLTYDLAWHHVDGVTTGAGRTKWLTLVHEYAHNFLEFGDLYGPQGCTGYWDVLGDHLAIGRMSEASAVHKARVGWLRWHAVVQGPRAGAREIELRPYTTSGDAVKVVPDPDHNPHEYFVLEYRRSTGLEPWRPDGGLTESGLFVTHMNDRFGGPASTWLLREAPYFDPELANFADRGGALWTGYDRVDGVLFGAGAMFSPTTSPASHLYGPRLSGVTISDIADRDGRLTFWLGVDCPSVVGWTNAPGDRMVSGRFTTADPTMGGEDVFIRNGGVAALLEHREAQWFVRDRWWSRVDDFVLLPGQRDLAADLDGDGLDELFVRATDTAAVLDWDGSTLRPRATSTGHIDGWSLGSDDWEVAADLDGDGREEIVVRSPGWIGVIGLEGDTLVLRSIQAERVDGWELAAGQRSYPGRFSRGDRRQLLVRDDWNLAVLDWTDAGFTAASVHQRLVGSWALRPGDRECVGDFDGDGLDEVYVQRGDRCAILKWADGAMSVAWEAAGTIAHRWPSGPAVTLNASDRPYNGRFMPDRDGILHRGGQRLALLTWEPGGLKVRALVTSPFVARWRLQDTDTLVLGDFHRTGLEFDLREPSDIVSDRITDVFLHNGRDTGMVGFTRPDPNPRVSDPGWDQFDLCWYAEQRLLFRVAPDQIAEPKDGRALDTGYIIGSLADGGYVLFRPGHPPLGVGPWDPAVIEAVRLLHSELRAHMSTLDGLGLRELVSPEGWTEEVVKAAAGLEPKVEHAAQAAAGGISKILSELQALGLEVVIDHKGVAAMEGYFPPQVPAKPLEG